MRRRRLLRALVLGAGVAVALLACNEFGRDDLADEPSPADIDGAAPRNDATTTVTDGGLDATSNADPRLPNGGFEAPGGGCGAGWTAFGGVTFERVPLARSGASACRVCNLVTGTTKGIHTVVPTDGGATRASAHFRSAPDGGNVAKGWIFLYALYEDGGGNPTPQSAQYAVDEEWTKATVEFPPSPGVTSLRLHLEAGEVGCLLFDDVAVESP